MTARRALGLPVIALAFLWPFAAPAATPGELARQASEDLRAAATALRQSRDADDRVAALAETVRAYEAGLASLRAGVRQAAIREEAIAAEFAARKAELERLVAVLITMSRAPQPALMIHPQGAVGTARSAMIVADITPALAERAAALRASLDEVRSMRAIRAAAQADLQFGLSGIRQARADLAAAIGRRAGVAIERVDQAALDALARSADSLDDFAANLPPGENAGEMPDRLLAPVPGRIIRRFREADAAGVRRPGLVLAAQPLSLVTAPVTATVRFSGPFRDYGNVMVLEPSPDTLIVLAGLRESYREAGQVVAAGDPLGLMRGDPLAEDAGTADGSQGSGTNRLETLYIEIRQNGAPVDPEPLFGQGTR